MAASGVWAVWKTRPLPLRNEDDWIRSWQLQYESKKENGCKKYVDPDVHRKTRQIPWGSVTRLDRDAVNTKPTPRPTPDRRRSYGALHCVTQGRPPTTTRPGTKTRPEKPVDWGPLGQTRHPRGLAARRSYSFRQWDGRLAWIESAGWADVSCRLVEAARDRSRARCLEATVAFQTETPLLRTGRGRWA